MQLVVSEEQAAVILVAADLWARIGRGELTALMGHPEIRRRLTTDQGVTTEDVRRLLESLKTAIFGLAADAYYDIHTSEIGESNRIALDIAHVLAGTAKAEPTFSDRWFDWCQQMQPRFLDAGYTCRILRPAVPSSYSTLELESDMLNAVVTCCGRSGTFTIDRAEHSMRHQTIGAGFNVSFRQFFHALGIDVSDVKDWF